MLDNQNTDKDFLLSDYYTNEIQTKDNIKNCRQFINDTLVQAGGEKINFIERTVIELGKFLQYNKEIHFLTESCFNLKQENLVNSINSKILKSQWNIHEFLRYFKPECKLQQNQKFETLPDLEKLSGDKIVRSLNFEEGKIYIIYIWTIYKSQ